MAEDAVINSNLPGLALLSRGKVRDIYTTSDPGHLLFVATDRISAYDVVLRNGVSGKGRILTQISLFWFSKLKGVIPNHFVTANIDEMPEEVIQYRESLDGRTMLVRKAEVIPIEAIVRGYLTGSAWSEYQASGTVHGISLPSGLIESQKFPVPLFTPSTKADAGQHDENISPQQAVFLLGEEMYERISTVSLQLYQLAAEYAFTRGLILADTKFEFGFDPITRALILIDELLTPDSSRYWPANSYEAGKSQPSFDKQYLRDWLVSSGFRKGLEEGLDGHGWLMSQDVIQGTRNRYEEVVRMLTVGGS